MKANLIWPWTITARRWCITADTYYNRGLVYQAKGQLDSALAEFNQALTIAPSDADAYYQRGSVYATKGKPALAVADYSQALANNPHYAYAYYERANIYLQQGQKLAALADLRAFIRYVGPDDSQQVATAKDLINRLGG